jgi:hypothetical protein
MLTINFGFPLAEKLTKTCGSQNKSNNIRSLSCVNGHNLFSFGDEAVIQQITVIKYLELKCLSTAYRNRLGGVVVSVLATGPEVLGFKPGRGDGFLRAIKIRSTTSFGWETKQEVPCPEILPHVKNPLRYFRY